MRTGALNFLKALNTAHKLKKLGHTPYIKPADSSEGYWLELDGFEEDKVLVGYPIVKFGKKIYKGAESGLPTHEFKISLDSIYKVKWIVADSID